MNKWTVIFFLGVAICLTIMQCSENHLKIEKERIKSEERIKMIKESVKTLDIPPSNY